MEDLLEQDRLRGEGETVSRKQLFEGALLRRRGAALPQHIAADRAIQAAFGAIFPSLGELGAAE
jgi:hypothetical protein